jgi:hypothetical protein
MIVACWGSASRPRWSSGISEVSVFIRSRSTGAHPGTTDVHLHLTNGTRTTVLRLGDGSRVSIRPALMADLKQLLGPGCLAAG